ncbi:MAG TPA: hypothetical protein GXZ82_00900 [Firmicutes bacterium]|jgi:hypothetical protein|nr:hypothetical protein [Bacillota bacterium]
MINKYDNLERNEKGRRMLEHQQRTDNVSSDLDELHRGLGERLTSGMLGLLDLLSDGGRNRQLDTTALIAVVRQCVVDELGSLRHEIADLSRQLDEVLAGIQRIDRFTMQRVLGLAKGDEACPGMTMPMIPAAIDSKTGRAPKSVVTEQVFLTAQRIVESGRDVTKMAATSLAREAGVKPAQFTYAFKNKETFLAMFKQWLEEQKSA